MRKYYHFLFLLLPLSFALPLNASVIKAGEKVSIDEPSDQNHYLAAGEIRVNAPIDGDVFAVGGKITITHAVSDDILLGGGEITVSGPIAGDMRVTGGKVRVSQNIGGDLIVAGGEVILENGVSIGGDLLVLGGSIRIEGKVMGNARIASGKVVFKNSTLNDLHYSGGKLDLDATVNGRSHLVADSIHLSSNTRFHGDVVYWQRAGETDFSPYLGAGASARYDADLREESSSGGSGWGLPVFWLLSDILLIILMVTFFGAFFRRHTGLLPSKIGSSLGYGMLFLIGVPIVAIIIMATVIGLPVGFIMLAGYSITLVLAGALVAIILAYEIEKRQGAKWTNLTIILVAMGISVALKLIALIPLLGALILPSFGAVAIGYLIYVFRNTKNNPPPDPDIV